MKHYVVLRSTRGLKLYFDQGRHGFMLDKGVDSAFARKEDAEAVALRHACADPRFMSMLEVVSENDGEKQDLSRYTTADLIDAFGDIQINVDAIPL